MICNLVCDWECLMSENVIVAKQKNNAIFEFVIPLPSAITP